MNSIQNLFGKNNSKEFIQNLPKITLFSLLGKILFSLVIIALILIIPSIIIFSFISNQENQYILIALFLYLALIFVSIKFFYSSFLQLKLQLTSLSIKQVLKHVAIIAIPFYIISFVLTLIYYLTNPAGIEQVISSFDALANSPAVINPYFDFFLFTSLWLLVGIAEELFFRGGIYRSLRNNTSLIFAVVISSLLFVIPHPPYGLSSLPIFLLGLIYAFYFEYKNNLLTIIILHAIHDLIGVALLAYLSAHSAQLILNSF